MADGAPSEPLFRASKRRKVLRKRISSDGSDPLPEGVSNDAEVVITKHSPEIEESVVTGVARIQKKRGSRRHGIGFTSGDTPRSIEVHNEEQALVLANGGEPEVLQTDRFVKPTGKVAVVEDKHMAAYIDSKLAEMRSSAATPINDANMRNGAFVPGARPDLEANIHNGIQSPSASTGASSGQRTLQQAQARKTKVYQRPTKRRQQPQRDQADMARDSLIDQIMRESELPLYDRSIAQTLREDGDELDHDAATAEAFKAQLIAEMEEHNRRRPPPSSAASKDKQASHGPKLGGSRAQREKMRAMEEAKASGGKK